jgi:hypothetical protein
MLIFIIKATIIAEALTELLSKSEIFSPIREFFFNRRKNKFLGFINSLLDCPYCTSVWMGFFVVVSMFLFNNTFTDIICVSIIVHRFSNIFHFIIDIFNKLKLIK